MEEGQLFRKKSLDSISAPEQLNDYIRVITPTVWIALAAVVILLAGAVVWGIFGRLETVTKTKATVHDGLAVCYVTGDVAEGMASDSVMRIGSAETPVSVVSDEPVLALYI